MPHRQKLLQLLANYGLRYPAEVLTTTRMQAFINDNAGCFQRQLAVGHVTGSAWLLDTTGKAVLLTHHRKLDIWVQLGGHADGETDIAAVALREAEEESGLVELQLACAEIFDIDTHPIPARGAEPAHWHYDCRFLVRATRSDAYVVSAESHDLAWVALAEVAGISNEESLLRMVAKTPQ